MTRPSPARLKKEVTHALQEYFAHLDGHKPARLYELVMAQVEAPLFQAVMHHVKGNQCRAAEILGLSRGTLRKKLQQYAMLPE